MTSVTTTSSIEASICDVILSAGARYEWANPNDLLVDIR